MAGGWYGVGSSPVACHGFTTPGALESRELVCVAQPLLITPALMQGEPFHQLRAGAELAVKRRHGSATPRLCLQRITGESAPVAQQGGEHRGLVRRH